MKTDPSFILIFTGLTITVVFVLPYGEETAVQKVEVSSHNDCICIFSRTHLWTPHSLHIDEEHLSNVLLLFGKPLAINNVKSPKPQNSFIEKQNKKLPKVIQKW